MRFSGLPALRSEALTLYQRTISVIISVLLAITAMSLFTAVLLSDGVDPLDIIRIALVAVSTLWLSWGAMLALNGLFFRHGPVARLPEGVALRGTTAILVPIYNEDPLGTYSRVAAMYSGLARIGPSDRFHFFILSDTREEAVARSEEAWFARLLAECGAQGRMFYRRRKGTTHLSPLTSRECRAFHVVKILKASMKMVRAISDWLRRGPALSSDWVAAAQVCHARS